MSGSSSASEGDFAPEVEVFDGNVSEMSIEFEEGDETAELLPLPAEIVSLCSLSPTVVVAGCMDDNAYVCRVAEDFKLELIQELPGHSDTVVDIVKNPKYCVFATASYDSTVRIYSSESYQLISVLEGPSAEIEFVRFNESGEKLLAGCADGAVWLWTLAFGSEGCEVEPANQLVLSGHNDVVTGGVFVGAKAVTISIDGHAIVWDTHTGKSVFRIRAPSSSPLVSIALGKQPGSVIIGCDSGMLLGLSTENGKILNQVQVCDNALESVAFNAAGSFVACGSTDGILSIRETPRLFSSVARHRIELGAGIAALAWHETENLVFVCTVAGEFIVFCPLTGRDVLRLTGGADPLLAMSLGKLSNGQSAVFAGGDDATLRMFALQLEDDEDGAADDLAKPAVP